VQCFFFLPVSLNPCSSLHFSLWENEFAAAVFTKRSCEIYSKELAIF
jgi:hypothetical protein